MYSPSVGKDNSCCSSVTVVGSQSENEQMQVILSWKRLGRHGDAVAVLACTLPGASPFPQGLPNSLTASWGARGESGKEQCCN